jgi:translocation protein SEC63
VTIPLTVSILRPSKEPSSLATRVKTSFQPEHAELVDSLRTAQKRKTRKVKRAIIVVVGWAVMAFMIYLIMVTERTVAKIWNPYGASLSSGSISSPVPNLYALLCLLTCALVSQISWESPT